MVVRSEGEGLAGHVSSRCIGVLVGHLQLVRSDAINELNGVTMWPTFFPRFYGSRIACVLIRRPVRGPDVVLVIVAMILNRPGLRHVRYTRAVQANSVR